MFNFSTFLQRFQVWTKKFHQSFCRAFGRQKKKFYNIREWHWLFPDACSFCKKISDGGILCTNCFSKTAFIEVPFCRKCGKMFIEGIPHNSLCTSCTNNERIFDTARALFVYRSCIRHTIINIKKTGDRNLISKCCKMIVARYGILFNDVDAIIPVPSHWTRTLIRGFNPADVIAWELSQLTDIPIVRKLKRKSRTKYQHKMSKTERVKNVEGVFKWEGKILNTALLVDDVFTTGATLNECAKTLRNMGTNKIFCITLASTEAK